MKSNDGTVTRKTWWRIACAIAVGLLAASSSFATPTTVLSIPTDLTGDHGATVQVPVSAAPSDGVLSIDMTVHYDPTVLQAESVAVSGIAASAGFTVASNVSTPGTVTISAFATAGALSGSGEVARIQFHVTGSVGHTSPLTINAASVNEGQIPSAVSNGLFTVTPLAMTLVLPNANGDTGTDVDVPLSALHADGALGITTTIHYDPTVVLAQNVTVTGIAAAAGYSVIANLTTPGTIILVFYSELDPLSGSGEIAKIRFHVVGLPSTATNLTFASWSVNEGDITTTVQNGTFTVNPQKALLYLPLDAVGSTGSTVQIPVSVFPGDAICSVDMTITYDPSVIQAQDVTVSGLGAAAGFSVVSNLATPGVIYITTYSNTVCLTGSGEFLRIQFHVSGALGTTSPLTFTYGLINEGRIPSSFHQGLFTVVTFCSTQPDGTPCNDLNACTQTDTCQGGVCVGSDPVSCPPQDQCHTAACDPATGGCIQTPKPDGTACDDGSACTSGDMCTAGVCTPGTPVVCNDNNVCTDDTCDPGSGCVYTNNTSPCDDGNACTSGDTCGGGTCHPGTPVVCNDNNPCTDDSCNPATGCVYVNNTNPCDDGNACTTGDTCGGGICHPGTPVVCNDNNPCTDDSCDPASGCVYTPNTSPCDDGNACTTGDTCGGGICHPGTPVVCNDNNPCTDDTCNPATGCVYTNNTSPCSDGNACTFGDTCGGGICHPGTPVVCNDNNPCTDDSCNPATGCVYVPNTNPCDDGNHCTQTDVCSGGICVGGNPVICTASDQCHVAGTCDPATGTCSNPNATDGTACSDGNPCTFNDNCQGGVCTIPAPPTWNVPGDNSNTCTTGNRSCDTIVGAVTAASSGDIIVVAAGSYPENVTISKSLILRGAQAGVNACTRTAVPLASESVLNPANATTRFSLNAACIVLDGFATTGGGGLQTGSPIASAGAQIDRDQILNNRVQGWTGNGVFLNRGGVNVAVRGNNVDATSVVGNGPTVQLNTQNFLGFEFTDNCLVWNGAPGTTAPTTAFAVDGNHNVAPSTGADGRPPRFSGNLVDSHTTGANLGRFAFTGGAIANNRFSNNHGDGLQGGIQSSVISGNTFFHNSGNGFSLTGFGGAGDATRGAQHDTITQNCFTYNGGTTGSGLFFTSGQFPGTISTNVAFDNSFSGNFRGAAYAGTETIDARNNYWGHPSGPKNPSQNPGGLGDQVDDPAGGGIIQLVPFETSTTLSCPCTAASCDDGNPCTTDVCDNTGSCVHTNNTNPCSDGNACTTGDTCGGGVCNPGTPTVCNDNNPCTDDTCNPATGCVYTPNTSPCDDGNACTSGDTCGGGICNPGTPVVCNDNNPCTDDTCNPATGCVYTPNTSPCDDGNACTSGDTCGGGICHPGTPVVCNDNNPCTDDTCDPATGCVYTNNTSPCDDGNACTSGDTCGGGICHPGTPVICNDNNPCTDDTCNPATGCVYTNNTSPCDDGNACTAGDTCGGGTCHPGTPVICNDNNPCTDDTCNPATGCVYTPNTSPCDDGNACTSGDTCGGGTCNPGTPVVCNDHNPCTDDTCNPATGCVYTPNTSPCDDGNACTAGDTCGGGTCHPGTPVICNDGNVCTDDSCNPATGCVYIPNTAPCSDGNACTAGDTCGGGICHPGTPVVCNDNNPCTDDTCDPVFGCVYAPNDANSCSDGNACTVDVCRGGACVCPTTSGVCSPSLATTYDSTDVPKAISTGAANTVTSTLTVSGADPYLYDVNVKTFITHTSTGQLQISIKSPSGTIVTLSSNNGGTLDNLFNGTLWDDSADPGNQAPFPANTFAASNIADDTVYTNLVVKPTLTPEEPLGAFIGENPNGVWTLTVADQTTGDGGSLDNWSLILKTLPVSPSMTTVSYPSPDVPKAIVDVGTIASTVSVSGAGTQIGRVRLTNFILHTFAADIDMTIKSPQGTIVTLTTDNGAGNDNVFNGTIWDDKADPGNQVPYVVPLAASNMVTDTVYTNLVVKPTLTPEEALAAFVGENPNGTWTLTISDDLGGDSGTLSAWSLEVTTTNCQVTSCAVDCNDNNPCTDDGCDPVSGCYHTNNTNTCNDGNACTSGDMCSGGICAGTPVNCNDNNVCTDDSCDPATGQCVHANNTNSCDDGNACTSGDHCAAPPVCGSTVNFDGVTAPALPAGWTSTASGSAIVWKTVSTSSDTPPNSAFGDDTNTGTGLTPGDELLVSPPIPITSPTATLTFKNRWAFESPTSCFDAGVLEISIGGGAFTDIVTAGGSFVSGGYTGTVSASFGSTLGGRAAWCSTSAGYPAYLTTAVNLPAAAAGQTIQLRWRVAIDTSAGATGQNIDTIVISDACAAVCTGSAVDCDDHNPCTDDSCNPATGCVHVNNTNPCDDGNACTTGDTCGGGICAGATITCDDHNPCTDDTCNPATGCVYTNNTNPCNDGNACTSGDVCGGGTCAGTPVGCDDANACTTDTCNPATGCVHTLLNCNDDNKCTNDSCDRVTGCVYAPVVCNDHSACTTDVCDPELGCTYTAISCNDHNTCTNDSCNPATGCVNTPVNCDDGSPCTLDACDPASGCTHTAISAPPETQNVTVAADKATYSWSAATYATRYDVVRGSIGQLPVGPGGGDESCFDNLPGTTLTDATTPSPGAGFFYLSRGENSCGNGTFGTWSNGTPRTTTTCP